METHANLGPWRRVRHGQARSQSLIVLKFLAWHTVFLRSSVRGICGFNWSVAHAIGPQGAIFYSAQADFFKLMATAVYALQADGLHRRHGLHGITSPIADRRKRCTACSRSPRPYKTSFLPKRETATTLRAVSLANCRREMPRNMAASAGRRNAAELAAEYLVVLLVFT